MSAEFLAIVGSLAYAATNICIRVGVRTTNVVTGLLITLVVGVAITFGVLLFDLPEAVSWPGVLLFAISGLFGPGLGRAASIIGIERLGAAAATPLVMSLYPIFAVAAAVLTLSETLGWQRVAGVVVVVLGVWFISARKDAATASAPEVAGGPHLRPLLRLPAVAFPLAGGFFYGASDVFRKGAADLLPNAVLGALIATACALLVWLGTWAASGRIRSQVRLGFSRGGWWFALSGVFSAVAVLAVTRALQLGDVSVVTPIVAAQSLPVLLLSAMFLRTSEPIDRTVVVGAISIVLGTIAISTD
jgi:drug/metabolite transporter (DMT)-like permease